MKSSFEGKGCSTDEKVLKLRRLIETTRVLSPTGISLKNNFPSKDIHYFQCDNHPEYHYPHCKKIPDVPKVTGLDIFWCNKLYDDKETDEREDKEYLKVDTLRKEHEDRD